MYACIYTSTQGTWNKHRRTLVACILLCEVFAAYFAVHNLYPILKTAVYVLRKKAQSFYADTNLVVG